MKIAYILPSLDNKGPIIVVKNLVRKLVEKGCTVDVFYFDDHPNPIISDVKTEKIDIESPIDFDCYDIIHSHTLRADYYLYKWKFLIKKSKIVSTIHQDAFKTFGYKFNTITSFIVTLGWCFLHRKFDGVIAVSDHLRNKYARLVGDIVTIHNGCDIGDSICDPNIESVLSMLRNSGYKTLATYSHITQNKGHIQVLDALDFLNDFVFVIIGDGPFLPELKRIVKMKKLEDRVFFLPHVKAPYTYLKFVDIFIMPSFSEGFGMAMVEAALSKMPIVCSSIPAFHELFDSKCVTFFSLNDVLSLVSAINDAYLRRFVMGERAYARAAARFSVESMANNHLEYYTKISFVGT